MIYVGIDPGLKGGVSFVTKAGDEWATIPMPEPEELRLILASWNLDYGIAHVFLERAQAMPKQGTVSMFNYGQHFGALRGILIALQIPYTLVPPQEWQKVMFQGSKIGKVKRDPKERALEIVRRLFPKETFLYSIRCKKPHDGMIDSILLAEYCRRKII